MKKLLYSFFFLSILTHAAIAQTTTTTEIFLKAIPSKFDVVDMEQDAAGNTYVLGRRGSSSVISQYDSAGINNQAEDIVIDNLIPVAFALGDDYDVYIASNTVVKRFTLNDPKPDDGGVRVGSPLPDGTELNSYTSLYSLIIKDIVFASGGSAGGNLVVGLERIDLPPLAIKLSPSLGWISNEFFIFERAGRGDGSSYANRATIRALTSDNQGNVYFVGDTGSNTITLWGGGYGPAQGEIPGTVDANREYVIKLSADFATYDLAQSGNFQQLFDINFKNGWLYLVGGKPDGTDDNTDYDLNVARMDTSLVEDKLFTISSPDYSSLAGKGDLNKKKFSVTADALDNVYVTGYAKNGTTVFTNYIDGTAESFRKIAGTTEIPFVAKVNSNFEFEWVKSPAQAPFPDFGSNLELAWDSVNSRLWLAGSYSGGTQLSMQEGSDASTLLTLSKDGSSSLGFTAVFEPDGAFTETVKLTIRTPYAEQNVLFNDALIGEKETILNPILNTEVTIQTPRTVYEVTVDTTLPGVIERTDSDQEDNQNIIDRSDTRFTFLNFAVDSVVQESNATVYSFFLEDETVIKLEWLVEYALEVDSDFNRTQSNVFEPDGSPYISALESAASGNPTPQVGKNWIEKDLPVTMQINGVLEDLTSHPGLPIRYVPYGFESSGAVKQVAVEGVPQGLVLFGTVEQRQQVQEFVMNGPGSVKYLWKLQYGVDMKTSNLSAESLLLVDFIQNKDGTTTASDAEGSGVYWYDDSATVRIAAPKALSFNDGPLALAGWLNGDNNIFDPEGAFDTAAADPLSAAQKDAGFLPFDYPNTGDETFIGLEVELNRPARVIWSYGDRIILKTVQVGSSVQFTEEEIASYGLLTEQLPTLNNPEPDGSTDPDTLPTASDFIWDNVAKRFLPIRPLKYNLLWPTENGNPAKVRVTSVWGAPNYQHIAATPGVSLISHPPESATNELVFQSVAYTTGNGTVDSDTQFTASVPGRTVLKFNRKQPAGRGGVAQSVVELKVVQTKLWNDGLGAPVDVIIGQKITSSYDLAGLDTGYLFFDKARYNPFIYDANLFIGEALWDSGNSPGPIIPVNRNPTASEATEDEFVVVWYDDPTVNDYFLWPYKAVRYTPDWPDASQGLSRILMSSGFGSESVIGPDPNNPIDQEVIGDIMVDGELVEAKTTFDPGRFEQVQVYVQADRETAGYNPNEEHALMAPSLRFNDVAPRPLAAYALRENDLNNTSSGPSYTSDPYVLVQFLDKADNEFKMKVYYVAREDTIHYNGKDRFSVEMEAGEPVIPFYPLGIVSGATLCESSYAREGDPKRLTYWRDHKFTAWAVSGGGEFDQFFYYPLSPDFYWPGGAKTVGECVAWLPNASTERDKPAFAINYEDPFQDPIAQGVNYTTVWPLEVPFLKVGETLTFAGGEYAADNPDAPGLPGVLAWAAGEVVYDDLNPDMREGAIDKDNKTFEDYTARIMAVMEQRVVPFLLADFPEDLLPATGRTKVDGTLYRFEELSASLKKRVFYNPLTGELGIEGLVNDKDIADDTLTAAPPAVYVVEPNILTQTEYDELKGVGEGSPFADVSANPKWTDAVDALFKKTRNPNDLSNFRKNDVGEGYTAGLQVQSISIPNQDDLVNANYAEAYQAKGPGLALVANPAFLDPNDTSLPEGGISYVTLAENNDPSLGGSPVILHVIKVDRSQRYRGAVKVVLSDNVFDENIILRHTGDFAAKAEDLTFDWWYRVEDGTEALPPDAIPAGQPNPWKFFPDPSDNEGKGFYQLKLKGNPSAPELLLADSLWFVRYRHKDEIPDDPISWERTPEIPYQWAGAGNSTPKDLDGNGEPDYLAQLAQGWVKRVLDAVNPYEARIRDFTGDAPATYASMIRQFGQRFEGPVALNPDKNVIENVGLIELYSTVLKRARDLSIDLSTPVSTPGITNALLLASSRLADFYMLLGNEAYSDAQDPMIGFGSDSVTYGNLATTVFTFQNQLSSQMEEELALLRGVYDFKARPVYNRLFWNFTKGEGEAAYAMAYNLSDVTLDGFINEDDAQVLYPQGHGDAWGHYLTAIRGQYELLNNPYFNWVSRSELYSLQNIVFEVDFLDERKFAQVASAKAKAGAEIVQLTYRDSYVADPESQWQGYLDTDPKRAWGVEGWARRAGQGAYFDWVTANALIPSEHPNSSYTGIRKVDRTTVKDIAVISANMNAIQQTFEDANDGYNPLGIAGNTVPFDIDPAQLGNGTTHFEQVYERAVAALNNASNVFDHANELDNMLRRVENTEIGFRRSVYEQDRTYRNQLIAIFGTPYTGTIGSGAAYPAGYDGPDTQLYMYVDPQVREISADTVPNYTVQFQNDINATITEGNVIDDFASFLSSLGIPGVEGVSDIIPSAISNLGSYTEGSFATAEFRSTFAPSFQSNNPSDWFGNFEGVNYIVTQDDGLTFDSDESRVGLQNIQLPIKASGYTFEADAGWGTRETPGQLQLHIAKMIQQEAQLAKAIAAWDGFQGGLIRQLRLIAAQIDTDDSIRGLLGGKIANDVILGLVNLASSTVGAVLGDAAGLAGDLGTDLKNFAPTNLPTGGFSISPGDALSAVRGGITTGATAAKAILLASKLTADTIANTAGLAQGLINSGLDFLIDGQSRDLSLKQSLAELENTVGDEGILRIEIYRQQEALRVLSDEYRALLQKGARLLDEREAYNKRVAELVQRNRYQDMSFRVSRNLALQNYHEAFDLAARYAYLAAKAYDYETNLDPSAAGSARSILTDIVGERSIGQMVVRQPYPGKGGLAEDLAKLKGNFDVLKGQLGLNNPQDETGSFSLRKELFRVSPDAGSDQAWSDVLEEAKVANLWDLPEFRRYCRPFAAYDPNSPEPGLVIEFSSEIMSRKNFFGRTLSGGDNAYDPTNFSTKIFSVGALFDGYLSSDFLTNDLAEAPRVYLVPVGSDVMLYPSDTNLGYRMWDVLDQKIPVPYPVDAANLDDNAWRPLDTLGGTEGEIRKFSSFRAYHDSGSSAGQMNFDTRLVGRSVWNTRWLLIIPGATLNADADAGLDTFINNISDIKLLFQTYGFSGN